MKDQLLSNSYEIPCGKDLLHLKRLYKDPKGKPVFMLHGSMEDGRIFYSKSGKGLGPYLADLGYDVFIADLSGRGKSKPHLSRKSTNSQTSAITKEIPAFHAFIKKLKGDKPQHWIAHSWGGVLTLAFIARFNPRDIASLAFFGTKRRIAVVHLERVLKVDVVWNVLGKMLSFIYGYFPAKNLKIGSDNEPRRYHRQLVKWVYAKKWIDPEDGFNYNEGLKKVSIPPTLYVAAINDTFLGHPEDVKKLMNEVGNEGNKFILLSRETGHLHNYNHINMLTHRDANQDHFPEVIKWIEAH